MCIYNNNHLFLAKQTLLKIIRVKHQKFLSLFFYHVSLHDFIIPKLCGKQKKYLILEFLSPQYFQKTQPSYLLDSIA
jgi:hypothetical protein